MPKVVLTQAQKARARQAERDKFISEGLLVYKAKAGLTYEAMAGRLGITVQSLRRIIRRQPCNLPFSVYWGVLDMVAEGGTTGPKGGCVRIEGQA